jgi:soluble lytic murein transglycosylase
MELLGVAQLGAKKKEAAAATFRRVVDYRPLSMPALLAAARLKEMGEAIPPMIAPAKTLSEADKEKHALSVSLPEKVWRLSRVGLDAQAEENLRKEESRLRKEFGKRGGEALCRLYGQLQSAQRRYQIAQTAASWSVLSHAPNSNSEWQWDCIYPSPYLEAVKREGKNRNVPPAFIYAVMRQESAFRPTVVSPANAVGLMQIIPPTAKKIAKGLSATYSPDLMRAPVVNIRFGSYYLRYLLDIFDGRHELAAASYNAGPQAVTRWLRAGENLPLDLFIARIPYSETRNYVYRVMGNYARYAYRNPTEPVPTIDLKLPTGLKAPPDAY